MVWREALFVDAALPLGLRSAPKIFTALADAAEWMVRQEGVDFIIHYLDDFLLMGSPGSEECARALWMCSNGLASLLQRTSWRDLQPS